MENEKTVPNVFIIESLGFEDEKDGLYEGEIISKILNFSDIKHQYFYIRTKQEFKHVIGLFEESNYRYLHISCHGNKNAISTTLDIIEFNELALILENVLDRKRLFISACSSVNQNLADKLLSVSECFSVIGPNKKINMGDAAIFWAAFYQLMFKNNRSAMKRDGLENTLKKLNNVYNLPLKYFATSENSMVGWKEVKLK
jgi:hypothetical protein